MQKFVLENQFGEESINYVLSNLLPLTNNVCIFSGATAPVNGTTGDNFAGPGSIYVARDSGLAYQQTGLITNPTWVATGSSSTGTLLTGFSAGAGTVAASDTVLQAFNKLAGNTQNLTVIGNLLTAFSAGAGTVSSSDSILGALQKVVGNQVILQNGKFSPAAETVSSAGALSTTLLESIVANASGGSIAVTLAAPSSQDSQFKIIKMTTATNPVTLAMTNIAMSGAYTPTGTTTLTFTSTGDSVVLMAVGAKWVYLGGSAIAS